MLEKIYDFGGLDLRSSDLQTPKNKSSDLKNVCLNSRREIVKRYGFDKILDNADILDLYHYSNKTKVVGMKAGGISVFNPSTLVFDDATVAMYTPPNYTGKFSFAEYNNVLYIADQESEHYIMKFDGYKFYQAGSPDLTVSGVSGTGYFTRVVRVMVDLRGNLVYSDFDQVETNDSTNITVTTNYQTDFNYKYGLVSTATIISSTSTYTLQVAAGHNFSSGDWICYLNLTFEGILPVPLQIESTTPTSVTFTSESVGSGSYIFSLGFPVDRGQFIQVYRSLYETYGYILIYENMVDNTAATQTFNLSAGGYSYAASSILDPVYPMDDICDTSVVRQLPPKAKYLSIHGDIMVAGNIISDLDVAYNELKSSIKWSDSTGRPGSTVESFLPFNVQKIGKSDEGEVSGLFSNTDYVEIHLDKQIYYLTGDLINSAYRLKSALSAGIGAISNRSIEEISGSSLFMSSKGLYAGRYGTFPLEISDSIEPLFSDSDLDLTSSVSTIDILGEKILIFIPSITGNHLVLVYDMYFKEWFKYYGIDATSGIVMVGNQLYHHDGTSLHRSNLEFNDAGKAIDAYYSTAWLNVGEPTLDKKFISAFIASMNTEEREIYIKSQSDWEEVDETSEVLEYTKKEILGHELNITQTNSMRLLLGNNIKNQPLHISGIEVDIEMQQVSPKGEY